MREALERAKKSWPHVRAILVTLHLIAILILATPSLGGAMSRAAWKEPTVQAEFAAWTKRLQGLGVDTDENRLEDWAWNMATRWTRFREALRAPTIPYSSYFGVRQRWRMFAAPHPFPARLEVEIEEPSGWRKVYVERSPEHEWLARELDHERLRSAMFKYSWPQNKKEYELFCNWIERRAREDFPRATRVRVQFIRYQTPSPDQVKRGELPKGKAEGRVVRRLRGSGA